MEILKELKILILTFLFQVTLTSYEALNDPAGVNGLDSASLSSKIENQTPNVKKRHRRNKSSSTKNADCEGDLSILILRNESFFLIFEKNFEI